MIMEETRVHVFTCDISDWRVARSDTHSRVYRPGAVTFLRRLVITLLMGGIAAGIHYAGGYMFLRGSRSGAALHGVDQSEELRRIEEETKKLMRDLGVDESELRAVREKSDAQRARLEVQHRRAVNGIRIAYLGLLGFLCLAGILPPISCLWGRVAIEQDLRGNLIVRRGGMWTKSVSWPIETLTGISHGVTEHRYSGGRHGPPRYLWHWFVRLESTTMTDSGGQRMTVNVPVAQFSLDAQKDSPGPKSRPPKRVADLLEWLRNTTGLPVRGPLIMDIAGTRRGSPAYRTCEAGDPAPAGRGRVVQSTTYASLDEMPPEIRARAEALMAEARARGETGEIRSERFTYRDSSGQMRTYSSVDEMPPEIREHFERLRRERRNP